MHHPPTVHIYGNGKVAVAFTGTCFINAQMLYLVALGLGIRLANPMIKDPPNAARILSHGLAYPVDRHLVFNEHHGVGFEQYCTSTAFSGLGHIHLFVGAVGLLHTRNFTMDMSGMLKEV